MKIISVFNQKGGVGKTTTVVNLSSAFGAGGFLGFKKKRVLVIDMDPQGNTTSGLGVEKGDYGIYNLLTEDIDINSVIVGTNSKNVDLIPSNEDLAGVEIEFLGEKDKEYILKNKIQNLEKIYDYIIIDCPPSLGILSVNSLIASDSVLIPIQCEYYALEGVSQLVNTLNIIRKGLNPNLEVEGVLLTMYDSRNNLSDDVVNEVREYFKEQVFNTVIPRNIRLAEAPSFGESVIYYDKHSKGAKAYVALAKEIVKRGK